MKPFVVTAITAVVVSLSAFSLGASLARLRTARELTRAAAPEPVSLANGRNVSAPNLPRLAGVPDKVIGGRNVNTVDWRAGTPPYRFDKPLTDPVDPIDGGWMHWAWIVVNTP